ATGGTIGGSGPGVGAGEIDAGVGAVAGLGGAATGIAGAGATAGCAATGTGLDIVGAVAGGTLATGTTATGTAGCGVAAFGEIGAVRPGGTPGAPLCSNNSCAALTMSSSVTCDFTK